MYTGRLAHDHTVADAATIELNLRQLRQRAPFINVALRDNVFVEGEGYRSRYDDGRLTLSIDDARELAAMLGYVVGLAEMGDT